MNIKIIVATHKPYEMPQDPVYLPLHVGHRNSKDIGFTGDDSGDHISEKNANYCELTGLYWAWKNLEADVIGLAHYRRHFLSPHPISKSVPHLTGSEIEELMREHDILLPFKRNYFIESNESQYVHAHHREGWDKMCEIIRTQYADYVPSLERMRKSTKGHRFNMMIMKRKCFDDYCHWLFDILSQVEKSVDISNYSVKEARIFGYLSERLLDVWLDTQKYSVKEIRVAFMEKQNWFLKITAFLKRKFLR